MTEYMCTVCPGETRKFSESNWPQHAKSKRHTEAGGDASSYWLPNEDHSDVAEAVEASVAQAAQEMIQDELDLDLPPIEVDEPEEEDIPIPELPELDDDSLLSKLKGVAEPGAEDSELAALRFQLAQAERERDEAVERAKEWRPDVDVVIYDTAEEAYNFFGREKLAHIAETRLAKMNKERVKQGLPPLYTGEPAEYRRLLEQEIVTICQEMVNRRNGIKKAKKIIAQRMLKMVKPDGNMVQVPVEEQINNGRGSLYDPIARYKEKGFKLPSPTRCNLRDCWDASAVVNGKYSYGGYCSYEHMVIIEGKDGKGRNDGRETRMLDLAART